MADAELALDLGWCIVRPITAHQQVWLRRVPKARRWVATLCRYAGITEDGWRSLTLEQKRKLWHAEGWMLRPERVPIVGRIVDPKALKAVLAPPPPPVWTRKPYTRRTTGGTCA